MSFVRLLYLRGGQDHEIPQKAGLRSPAMEVQVFEVSTKAELTARGKEGIWDALLIDTSAEGFRWQDAVVVAREVAPGTPVMLLTNALDPPDVNEVIESGVVDLIPEGQPAYLAAAVNRIGLLSFERSRRLRLERRQPGMTRLLRAVQDLSLARDIQNVMAIVRSAARELCEADGATFVLKDGDRCYYADEDAILPLWKGQRFPLARCVSGWVMTNRAPLVIPDIAEDDRIPYEIYEPTFVRSVVMVPIRESDPIGAIGIYWARHNEPDPADVELLQALANTTAVAMESVGLYEELERRVRSRTLQLEAANQELEAYSYSVAHDLRGPLHAVGGYASLVALQEELDAEARGFLEEIQTSVTRMNGLIDDLLRLARLGSVQLEPKSLSLSDLAKECLQRLSATDPDRKVEISVEPGVIAWADSGLISAVLENLLSNAWKYSARQANARISFGSMPARDGQQVFFVQDNGAGFDPASAGKLFTPFHRLHSEHEFKGTGVGLATVQRIIHRHGGLVWAEAAVHQGATFYFSLPPEPLAA